MPVFLDPSFADRVDHDMVGQCEAIIPNVEDAGTLAGHPVGSRDAAVHAGLQLRRSGVRVVCVKLPDGGCVIATRSGVWCIDGSHAEAVDTTGAGDAMSAVLTVSMLEGHEPLQAALRGVAAANLAILRYGSQPDFVSRQDVDRLARRLAPHFVTGPRPSRGGPAHGRGVRTDGIARRNGRTTSKEYARHRQSTATELRWVVIRRSFFPHPAKVPQGLVGASTRPAYNI